MKLKTLHDLFAHHVHELCLAQAESTDVLAAMRSAALSPTLAAALEDQRRCAAVHARQLRAVIAGLPDPPPGPADAGKGLPALLEECLDGIHEDAEPHVRDAMLISLAQRIAHEEIAIYGCVRTWARLLGEDEAAAVLQPALDRTRDLDRKLTAVARELNQEALAAGLLI